MAMFAYVCLGIASLLALVFRHALADAAAQAAAPLGAGLTLLALYGQDSPVGLDVAYTRAGVALALLFVTLPFVVRSVQPILSDLDIEAEEASASLGATRWQTFRRVILPALRPATRKPCSGP